MFYQKEMDDSLRFGDVLRGYPATTPSIKEPILKLSALHEVYQIDVSVPLFCVVLSPCCSIGRQVIALTPLIQIRNRFFDNPYFSEDLTRINRKMEPQQTVPSSVWGGFPPEEKQRRLAEGTGYAFLELFIYEKNSILPKYTVHRKDGNIETNYYMIDFRNTYRLDCQRIKSPGDAPIESRCLQLSIEARSELRDKIAYYYARIPEEDKILED